MREKLHVTLNNLFFLFFFFATINLLYDYSIITLWLLFDTSICRTGRFVGENFWNLSGTILWRDHMEIKWGVVKNNLRDSWTWHFLFGEERGGQPWLKNFLLKVTEGKKNPCRDLMTYLNEIHLQRLKNISAILPSRAISHDRVPVRKTCSFDPRKCTPTRDWKGGCRLVKPQISFLVMEDWNRTLAQLQSY